MSATRDGSRAPPGSTVSCSSSVPWSCPTGVLAGVKVFDSADQTLERGLRLPPRIEFERVAASGGGTEGQRDFLIRPARLYDQPFSRDRPTSDSKQRTVGRGEVSNFPTRWVWPTTWRASISSGR